MHSSILVESAWKGFKILSSSPGSMCTHLPRTYTRMFFSRYIYCYIARLFWYICAYTAFRSIYFPRVSRVGPECLTLPRTCNSLSHDLVQSTKLALNFWFGQGGAWCYNATTCYERTQDRLGSSKLMTKNYTFSGILSNKAKYSPGKLTLHLQLEFFLTYCIFEWKDSPPKFKFVIF